MAIQRGAIVTKDVVVSSSCADCACTTAARVALKSGAAKRAGRLRVGVTADRSTLTAEDVGVTGGSGATAYLAGRSDTARRDDRLSVGVTAQRSTLITEDVCVTGTVEGASSLEAVMATHPDVLAADDPGRHSAAGGRLTGD
jgi:hypothetical protein